MLLKAWHSHGCKISKVLIYETDTLCKQQFVRFQLQTDFRQIISAATEPGIDSMVSGIKGNSVSGW